MLAPHARLRAAVVATAGPGEALAHQLRDAASRMELPETIKPPSASPSRRERYAWAMLLARIYEVLPLVCPQCNADYVC